MEVANFDFKGKFSDYIMLVLWFSKAGQDDFCYDFLSVQVETVSPNLRLGLKTGYWKKSLILIQSPRNFAKLSTSKIGHNARMWAWLDQNYIFFHLPIFRPSRKLGETVSRSPKYVSDIFKLKSKLNSNQSPTSAFTAVFPLTSYNILERGISGARSLFFWLLNLLSQIQNKFLSSLSTYT